MAISFVKAKREQLWVRVLLGGSSGSGKTYSALRLATGLAGKAGSRIAYIDTENGRARYYANEFDFDCIELEEPFKPDKYIEAIDAAIRAGYKVLVIDSISHEWQWCNNTVNSMNGSSFQNWGKIKTQFHNKFVEKIIQSPIHIIATARGKDEYTMDEKDGKKVPKKIGLGIQQEANQEYEYTVAFNIAQDTHIATITKDNTHYFENRYEKLTEKDGEYLYDWANDGETPAPKPAKPVVVEANPKEIISQITAIAKRAFANGADRDEFYDVVETTCGTKNYNKVSDVKLLVETLEAVRKFAE